MEPDQTKKSAAQGLVTNSCTFSKKHRFRNLKGSCSPEIRWNEERLEVRCADDISHLSWKHITGIWVVLRTKAPRSPKGGMQGTFTVDFYFETNFATEMDFLVFTGDMDSTLGKFLEDVRRIRGDKLKEGRPPTMVMSELAFYCFYRWPSPANSNRLRVAFGWTNLLFEVIFAIMFFTQVTNIALNKGWKAYEAFEALHGGSWMSRITHACVLAFYIKSLAGLFHALRSAISGVLRGKDKVVKSIMDREKVKDDLKNFVKPIYQRAKSMTEDKNFVKPLYQRAKTMTEDFKNK